MKKFILLFGMIICGIVVWSCSQNEDSECNQRSYSYSPKELSQIQELAEKYGIPEIHYIKEATSPLPTMQELEETFKIFAAIKANMNIPLVVLQQDSNTVYYRTKEIPFRRVQYGGEIYSGSQDLSTYISVSSYQCWLNMSVSWKNSNPTVGTSKQEVTASASLELSLELEYLGFSVEDSKTSWSWVGSTGILVSYEANVVKRDSEGKIICSLSASHSDTANVG